MLRAKYMAIGHEQIECAVAVVVERNRAKPQGIVSMPCDPGAPTGVEELQAIALVLVECPFLLVKVGQVNVIEPVAIEVSTGNPHAGFFKAAFTDGTSGNRGQVQEQMVIV